MKISQIEMKLLTNCHFPGTPYVYRGVLYSALGFYVRPTIYVDMIRKHFDFENGILLPRTIWFSLHEHPGRDRVRIHPWVGGLKIGKEPLDTFDWQAFAFFYSLLEGYASIYAEVDYDDSEWYDEETFTWLR
jgi:hypothetical protein